MNWRAAILSTLFVLPLIIVLAAGFGTDPHAVPNLLINNPAPDFELATVDGKTFSSKSLKGKPTLLNFWSTWCEPCKLEHELLQEASKFYGDRVQFVGIVYQDNVEAAQAYLKVRSNLYPQLMDEGSRSAIDYGVSGVPETYVLSADGTVIHKEAGVISGAVIRQYIDPMLAAAAPSAKPGRGTATP